MNHAEWNREWNKMKRREYDFLANGRFKKDSPLNKLIEKKIPASMQGKIDSAFAKAFELVFDKGTGIIEKTYDKEGIERHFENMTTAPDSQIYDSRKGLRYFAKKAGSSKTKNILFSGTSGIGLGVLGVGMPDIAVFTTTMLKGIYEIAVNFGYSYDTPEEKYFILKIVETSLSYGKMLDNGNDTLNDWIDEPALPENYVQSDQVALASQSLSRELLYMKFVQAIPVVGVIGGAYDPIYLRKILRYAELKYHRRFLHDIASQTDDGPDIA